MSSIQWTKEQLQAIQESGTNILVAAAAGSGKTAVLVERIIQKILRDKIDVDELLVVTFTNAAASEMKERILEAIYQKLEEQPQNTHLQKQMNLIGRANICTIDSFCLEVVKNHFYEIDVSPSFRIIDTAELELMKQEVLDDLFEQKYEEEDASFLMLLETYTTYASDEPLKELIQNIHTFLQSNPFPTEWFEKQIEKYNIKDENMDFSKTEWGKIQIDNLKEELNYAKINLQQLKKKIEKWEELKKYANVIDQDIQTVDQFLDSTQWDEIYELATKLQFEKWPVDKKIVSEEKEEAKEKRDLLRKEIKKEIEKIDCSSKKAIEDMKAMYPVLKALQAILTEYMVRLQQEKKEKDVVDFSDIEHMALQILLQKQEDGLYVPTEVAKKYQKKFVEIAIDEYQDSNLVQEYILNAIARGNNIFMVGDVKQSIYKFRQARPELFLEKYETYAKEKQANKPGMKIQLFQNFRSRKNILDITNLIFQEIMSKKLGEIEYNQEEYLNSGASYEETKQPGVGTLAELVIIDKKEPTIESEKIEDTIQEEPVQDIEVEAKWVAQKIQEMILSKQVVWDKKVGYRPITYRDIVILLRSTKDKANIFENALMSLQIPVYSDTSVEYLNSIEIQTIMNVLKVMDNPMVDIPLVAVLRSPIGGFTDNELMKIRLEQSNQTFYESIQEYVKKETADFSLKEKIEKFWEQIKKWKSEAEYLGLDELIWNICLETGYYHYVGLMLDGSVRQANLKLLFEKAKQYEKTNFQGLYYFIRFIEKVRNSSGDLSAAKLIGENENVVRIMSIHKSKGLEFPVVFLCNTQKKFNMQDLNSPILLHQDLGLGVSYAQSEPKIQYPTFAKEAIAKKTKEEIISEEMRILYVALTRAKEKLIITGVVSDLEENLKKKENSLSFYLKSEKMNAYLLKKNTSYLDWIEFVYLKNKEKNYIQLKKVTKESISNAIQEKNEEVEGKKFEDITLEECIHREEILKKINWQYENILLSKIEGKTSVSKIKQKGNTETIPIQNLVTPEFLIEEEKVKLSGAEKGTLLHLCLQNLDRQEDYNEEKIKELIQKLEMQKKITKKEAENIDVSKILNFTKSKIWKEVKEAKFVEREKSFYITIPAKEVYENCSIEEGILVQGVIDLFYINKKDELILVDYKTDYVTNAEQLIEKYVKQLELYKRALEASMNRRVDKIYIYSMCLNKAIKITR